MSIFKKTPRSYLFVRDLILLCELINVNKPAPRNLGPPKLGALSRARLVACIEIMAHCAKDSHLFPTVLRFTNGTSFGRLCCTGWYSSHTLIGWSHGFRSLMMARDGDGVLIPPRQRRQQSSYL
jgi:hypothetical protein